MKIKESRLQTFLRFLRFGLLAWGGPVAQIAMIKQEMVEEEKWITPEKFNRVLSVYQILPGPEAHELCVYFGMLSGGRVSAILAGLGFMLPGFILMFLLSCFYVTYGIDLPVLKYIFFGLQPAVVALFVRAVHRIGGHALTDNWLWFIAIASAALQFMNINFLIVLAMSGVFYSIIKNQINSNSLKVLFPFPLIIFSGVVIPSTYLLFFSGLRSGLLTFGGAYTVIPFLQHDAVVMGGWMTNQQFLDGLALSSILPAPLIIFSTFVGYLGGGPLGALAITAGIFLPAFAFTLLGHSFFEKVIENKALHAFLDGVTAGVVGIIGITSLNLFQSAVVDLDSVIIFIVSLFLVYWLRAKWSVAVIMLVAGVIGVTAHLLY